MSQTYNGVQWRKRFYLQYLAGFGVSHSNLDSLNCTVKKMMKKVKKAAKAGSEFLCVFEWFLKNGEK